MRAERQKVRLNWRVFRAGATICIAATATVVVISCDRGGSPTPLIGSDADHWEYFGVTDAAVRARYSQDDWQTTEPALEFAREHLPYDSIALARHGCEGAFCPDFEIRLRKSGSAVFVGRWLVPMEGTWAGELDLSDFARVCHAVELLAAKVAPVAAAPNSGRDGGFTLLFWPSGVEAALTFAGSYGDGPTEAWVLRSAIEGLLLHVRWSEVGVDSLESPSRH